MYYLFSISLFFMLAVTYSVALIGVQAEAITIEVNSGERIKAIKSIRWKKDSKNS